MTVPAAAVLLPLTKKATLPAAPDGVTVAERLVVPPNVEEEAVMLPTVVATLFLVTVRSPKLLDDVCVAFPANVAITSSTWTLAAGSKPAGHETVAVATPDELVVPEPVQTTDVSSVSTLKLIVCPERAGERVAVTDTDEIDEAPET